MRTKLEIPGILQSPVKSGANIDVDLDTAIATQPDYRDAEIAKLKSQRDLLLARVEELERALEPLVAATNKYDWALARDDEFFGKFAGGVTYGDLRKARSLLSPSHTNKE